jgi:hypothetical protein
VNPPFVGTAVYVTAVPEHTGFADGEMVTLTVSGFATVMVIEFDNAGFPVTQEPRLEVSQHRTTSPLTGIYVNVGLFVPTLAPFTCH